MPKKLRAKTHDFYYNAALYDSMFNLSWDIAFWKKWCKKAGPSVLELCCGTGRVAIPLIEAGFDYTGIDSSNIFLTAAKKKAKVLKGEYSFFRRDIRTFNLKRKYDSIIIPFNAFLHMYSYKDAQKCFAVVRKHLKKNGLFIIDIFNPDLKFLVRDPKRRYGHKRLKNYKNLGLKVSETIVHYDKTTQINHILWYFNFKDKPREVKKHLYLRIYFPEELMALLDYNGFKVIKRFGCHKGSAFTSESRNQILIAKSK